MAAMPKPDDTAPAFTLNREYMGVARTTFLIGPNGKIAHVWEKVRVKDHAESVFQACCDLS
ncbi:thioredoxin domain-containing protein [Desulfosudis oleivorans]|uniref:Redoxin domain-containing protein n=1 Tax=Desulfosudis oleivorans (strain DSM 6200 / JCM 39069 / Hxd3) TaxID=96561 RepID=A8ZVK7_DESOH|nr:hypothetical protein [Desulfosudis oleivorans]ABW68194.1 hypothetical protein Dole_2390 [Desulfosudis oleivorans Hxd3]